MQIATPIPYFYILAMAPVQLNAFFKVGRFGLFIWLFSKTF
jgi:hypothetical protein